MEINCLQIFCKELSLWSREYDQYVCGIIRYTLGSSYLLMNERKFIFLSSNFGSLDL